MINMKFNLFDDAQMDHLSVVVEQTTPDGSKAEILNHIENPNGLNFLRFRACLQTFGHRNRNRRLWKASHTRPMIEDSHICELVKRSGLPGENGHPVPPSAQVTMERIMTIDPNNMSHRIMGFEWRGDNALYGIIETLDEGPGTPGYKFMRNILQNMDPSFSARSVVPQRKNRDGTIDVTGKGRLITYDRVILPSHEGAYIDLDVPIKNIVTQSQFDVVMEGFTDFMINQSEKFKKITDNLEPVMESATLNENGIITINTEKAGRVIFGIENKHRQEISNFMKNI